MWGRKSVAKIRKELRTLWQELRVWRLMMRATVQEQQELVRRGIEVPEIFHICLAQRKENERAFRLQRSYRLALEVRIRKLVRELVRLQHAV